MCVTVVIWPVLLLRVVYYFKGGKTSSTLSTWYIFYEEKYQKQVSVSLINGTECWKIMQRWLHDAANTE